MNALSFADKADITLIWAGAFCFSLIRAASLFSAPQFNGNSFPLRNTTTYTSFEEFSHGASFTGVHQNYTPAASRRYSSHSGAHSELASITGSYPPSMHKPTSRKQGEFQSWFDDLKDEACLGCNADPHLVEQALSLVDVDPDSEVVLGSDHPPLEQAEEPLPGPEMAGVEVTCESTPTGKLETMPEHVMRMVSQDRISMGRALILVHKQQIKQIAAETGVPWQLLLAIWGIETNYGSYMGEHDVLTVLVTDAFRHRGTELGDYLKREVFASLRLLSEGYVTVGFKGSAAGAVGQCQFMPSNFFTFAVDYDSDGKADIWNSVEDALASIAKFLTSHGYKPGTHYGALASLDTSNSAPQVRALRDKTSSL